MYIRFIPTFGLIAAFITAGVACQSFDKDSSEAGKETEKTVMDVMAIPGESLDYDRYRLQVADLKDRKESLQKELDRLKTEKAQLEKKLEQAG